MDMATLKQACRVNWASSCLRESQVSQLLSWDSWFTYYTQAERNHFLGFRSYFLIVFRFLQVLWNAENSLGIMLPRDPAHLSLSLSLSWNHLFGWAQLKPQEDEKDDRARQILDSQPERMNRLASMQQLFGAQCEDRVVEGLRVLSGLCATSTFSSASRAWGNGLTRR